MKSGFFVLLLVVLLSPFAHSQNENVYEVYAIEYAVKSSYTPVKLIALNVTNNDSVLFSYYVWYLRGSNGHRILVDTGFPPDTGTPEPHFATFERLDAALQKLQLKPDDITDVIITHPHVDHIGGLPLFPKARLWMQENDYSYYVGDAWQEGGDRRGLDKRTVPLLVEANLEGRLHLIDGDSVEFIPGIRAFIGSKHTFESQHVLVATGSGNVMLASDDSWFYYNVEHLVPIVLTFDAQAYTAALKRMRTLVDDPALIIPGHDSQVMQRFRLVVPGVVKVR